MQVENGMGVAIGNRRVGEPPDMRSFERWLGKLVRE